MHMHACLPDLERTSDAYASTMHTRIRYCMQELYLRRLEYLYCTFKSYLAMLCSWLKGYKMHQLHQLTRVLSSH